ncbi:hypothetical protein CC2G_001554 [Coprinopsis cinerea AmutBmut pab1-1]|nr:hypothetical protein CC2G_001554 [Coprinopsis cinerea AmutBmut pab1-1]
MWHRCNDCDRSFSTSSALNDHCRSLGHEQDLYCKNCDKHFTSSYGLQQHLESSSAHRTCRNCIVTFDTLKQFRRHRGGCR